MRCIKKRGQAWGFDLMVASIIFVAGIIVFFLYSLNYPTETEENLNSLFYQGNKIANDLTSNGFPKDWNSSNVIKIGLTTDDRINQTKLERFYNLANTSYLETKSLFNTKFDYYINFSQVIEVNGNKISHIGLYPYTGVPDNSVRSIIKVSRIITYKNNVTVMDINIWEK